MKKRLFYSIAFSVSCLGLVTGGLLAAAPAQGNMKAAKADDGYTVVETSVTKVKFVWNWLTVEFDNFDGGTEQASYASSTIPADLNYLTNVYINGDPSLKAYEQGTSVLGYAIEGAANRFWTAPSAATKANDYANLKTITIPAGTEFPARTTATGGEKIKYVTKEDVTFHVLGGRTGNFELTKEDKINFVPTSVLDFSATKPNQAWPAFKLSVNDYPTSRATLDNNTVNTAMYGYLNTLTNIKHTNYDRVTYSLGAKTLGGTAFLNYGSNYNGYISYAVDGLWNKLDSYKVIYIPAGTQFPSYQYYTNCNNPQANKTIYYTTEDVIFYLSGGNNTTNYTRVVPAFEENKIVSINGLTPFEQGGALFTNFNFNLEHVNQARGTAGLGYDSKWALTQAMSYVEIYDAENNLVSLNNDSGVCDYNFGAMFTDFNNGANDYLVQIKTDKFDGASKVVFKKDAFLPSSGYLAGANNTWYKFAEDQVFISVAGVYGCYNTVRDFTNNFMHPEIGATDMGSGKCISEGWYAAAKVAFNALSVADKVMFANYAEFVPFWVRLNSWATENGDAFNAASFGFQKNNNITIDNSSSKTFIVEGIAAAALLTIAGAAILSKKKKHN